MGDVMPKEQQEFIDELEKYILEASNMDKDEAYQFAFIVWQHRKHLKAFLTKDDKCAVSIDWEHECKRLTVINDDLEKKLSECDAQLQLCDRELQTCYSDKKVLSAQLDIVKLIFGGNKS